MKRFIISIIILLSCKLIIAQDQLIKAAPFHFLFGGKVDYEYAYKQNSSIGIAIDYFTIYNEPSADKGILFKPYYRYYFGRNTMPSRGFYLMPSIYLGQTRMEMDYGDCDPYDWYSYKVSCFDTTLTMFTYGAGLEIGWQDNIGPKNRVILDFSLGVKFIPIPASAPKSYTNEHGKTWELIERNPFPLPLFEIPGWNRTYPGFPFNFSFMVGYKIFKSD